MSHDHPELAWLEALQADGKPMYTRGRPDGPPLWIVVHDMEAHELPTTAEAVAQYFHTGAGGTEVSSHYTADNDSIVQCVHLGDVAWTVGNRPGNYRGINWEFAGFARQTAAEWLDPFGVAMFNRAAPVIRSDAARYGIPLRRCTIADLVAYRPGVTSHNDLRIAFNVTTHTDPGPNFPWDWFIALLNDAPIEEETEMRMIRCNENGGYYSYPVPKWYRSEAAVDAALAAYGQTRSDVIGIATLDEVRQAFGYVPGVDTATDGYGNVLPSGGAPGGGASADEVRAIVDEELDEAFSGAADTDG